MKRAAKRPGRVFRRANCRTSSPRCSARRFCRFWTRSLFRAPNGAIERRLWRYLGPDKNLRDRETIEGSQDSNLPIFVACRGRNAMALWRLTPRSPSPPTIARAAPRRLLPGAGLFFCEADLHQDDRPNICVRRFPDSYCLPRSSAAARLPAAGTRFEAFALGASTILSIGVLPFSA
jgi:hypothetical protein